MNSKKTPPGSDPLATATLPQYLHSAEVSRRFREAALEGLSALRKAQWTPDLNAVDESEKSADAIHYFFDRKSALEEEFLADLSERIEPQQAQYFVDVVANDWFFDPNSRRSQELKASVRRYLRYLGASEDEVEGLIRGPKLLSHSASFSPLEIQDILDTTHQLLFKHLNEWNNTRDEPERQSRDTVFLRRGIALSEPFPEGYRYREWDFINAYSLTVSVSERFSLTKQTPSTAAIISVANLC